LSGYKDKSDHAQWTCTENLFWRKKLVLIQNVCWMCGSKGEKDNSDWVVAQLWNLEFEEGMIWPVNI